MLYDDVRQSYGDHIAKRVQRELSAGEFHEAAADTLTQFLEARAEDAHQTYKARLTHNLSSLGIKGEITPSIETLHRRWREAEDLAYIVSVAEDVSQNLRTTSLKT